MAERATWEFSAGKVFRGYMEKLMEAIQLADIPMLTVKLYSKEIISENTRDKVLLPNLTKLEKNGLLLTAVEDAIKTQPQVLVTLLDILNEFKPADLIAQEMRQQLLDSELQSAKTPTATPTSTDITSQQPGDEDHTSTTADEDTHTGTSPDAVGTQNRNLVMQYIEQQGSLPVRSLKSFLIGPPCVGKTSARRCLMGEIKHISRDEIVPSTGIDAPLTVRLHHPTEHSSVLLSEGWHNQGLEDQCRALCSYALNSPAAPSSSRSATPPPSDIPVAASRITRPMSKLTSLFKQAFSRRSQPTVATTQDAPKVTHDTATAAQDELTTVLTTLVKDDDWKTIRDFLTNIKELAFLNIVDIGGQPEFHEILPLLLHGLALNLIFLNTTQDLDSPYTVVYRDGSGDDSPQYTSESTIRQVIQHALCAISSLQTSDEENKSAAILIGTYCDLTDKSAVLALDQLIQESFKEADFMKKDVLCAVSKPGEKRQYIYPLDNVSGDPSEIDKLRHLISTIVYDRFTPVMVPTSALLLHLILRMKFGNTRGWCTLEECIEIAKNCGISKEDLLHENGILQYLHDNFGTILYYRKVNKLCLRVIVDTNVIMGPPSRLFLMAFGALKTKQQTAEYIRDTGKISHYLMTKVCSHFLDDAASDDDIPTDEIVELLKARYIIFEYPRSYSNDPVYFMPALLYPDHNVAKESSNPDLLASLPFPPVVFLPSSGDVPLGQFPATAVNLSKYWKPDEKNQYRNRIRFYAKCKHNRLLHVELRNLSTYLEFRVLSEPSIDASLMVESIQILWKVFAELSSLYSHTQNITWSVGFYCPHSLQSGRQPHTATCNSRDNPQEMICSQYGRLVPLNGKHKSWFMNTRQQQHCDLNLECSDQHFAKISRSIVDWREIAPFLGLTEAEEIIIRDSTPNSIPTQKMAMLRKWKQKLGTKATYECLCQAFEDCEKGNLVELVKQLAASSSSSES